MHQREINIRFENQSDIDKLSEKLGLSLLRNCHLYILDHDPDLFGNTRTQYIKESKLQNNESEIDISEFNWEGMPHYSSKKVYPYSKTILHTNLSIKALSEIFEQPITNRTKAIWYPKLDKQSLSSKLWVDDTGIKPKYPVYIISKGRPECLTAKTLDFMGVDYRIVIEPSEADLYKNWGDKVLIGGFDTTTSSSIPVRNWVNEHCQEPKYWLLDDNIRYFYILTNNESCRCKSGAIFAAIEDYTERYSNIALAGMNKLGFCKPTDKSSPYVVNTRVYSVTLMNKALNEKIKIDGELWRGRYNEDTDLNIRFLKAGYSTLNFQMFLADKVTTQRCKGGNTDTVYVDGDRRLKFAQSLKEQHPDVVRIVEKWGRYHHKVDWGVFAENRPRLKAKYPIRNYGISLQEGEFKSIFAL